MSKESDNIDFSALPFDVPHALRPNFTVIFDWFRHAASSRYEHSELEGRIGHFDADKQRFVSDVDPQWFMSKLAHFLAPGTQWDRIEDETTTSYLFENGLRAVQRADDTAVFVRKERRSTVDVRFSGCEYDVRFAHAVEIPQDPPCATSTWVRKRQRKSFYLGAFRFDFSNIMEAATLQAALEQPIKHEIEIEYVPHALSDTSKSCWKDAAYCALTMIMLLQDLVTPNGTDATADAQALQILRTKSKS